MTRAAASERGIGATPLAPRAGAHGEAPPRVSVLLPARDAGATLDVALRSLVRQRFVDWECVVVDDGSRDATGAVAAAWAARDPRFRCLAGPATGVSAALRVGLAACRGALVARLDADDFAHRDRLVLQVAALDADPTLDGVGCHVRLFPRAGLSGGLRRHEAWLGSLRTPDDVARERFVELPLAAPGWCFRRAVYDEHPFRDVRWPEDWDVVLRALAAGRRLGVVPRRLVSWRDGPGRATRSHPSCTPAALAACRAHHLARGFLAGAPRYLLWGHGAAGKALRRALAAEGRHVAGIVELHPRRVGQRVDGAPVVAPAALGELPRLPLVIAVGDPPAAPGAPLRPGAARAEARARATALGLVEGVEFVCAG